MIYEQSIIIQAPENNILILSKCQTDKFIEITSVSSLRIPDGYELNINSIGHNKHVNTTWKIFNTAQTLWNTYNDSQSTSNHAYRPIRLQKCLPRQLNPISSRIDGRNSRLYLKFNYWNTNSNVDFNYHHYSTYMNY